MPEPTNKKDDKNTVMYDGKVNPKEEDRFNSAILGVKKAFREDFNKSENSIFINKLNYVCRNYETTH